MPYARLDDLPDAIRASLPLAAQAIYRAAFNAAYARYGAREEARVHRIAWAAVKRVYVRRAPHVWVKRHHAHAIT